MIIFLLGVGVGWFAACPERREKVKEFVTSFFPKK